jgi:formate dehydrogenase major subunit
MASFAIYINGQEVQAEEGQTVLQAAQAAGIHIPTLCHHPMLSSFGGCRMCLVEVEPRGQLHPACTFPVAPGLRVHTHSEKVLKAREFVLQWLFSERGHYCMYCAASGECELQKLAYEHGIDHWLYGRPDERYPIDASRKYFLMDHNRCVLCRRCVRACAEISAVHTLGVGERGARSIIVADLDVPFGESTCISCGTCLQVCPVGALIDRRSAYMGRDELLGATRSICFGCSIGCGIVGRTRSQKLLRIEGDWDAPVNRGLLCSRGRFEPLYVAAMRISAPMKKQVNGEFSRCSEAEALALVQEQIASASGGVGLYVSSRSSNEELEALVDSLGARPGSLWLLDGRPAAPIEGARIGTLADVQEARLILAVGASLDDENEVLACYMRRAVDKGAALYLVGCRAAKLERLAAAVLPMGELAEAIAAAASAAAPVVVYGPGIGRQAHALLAGLRQATFLPIPEGVNTVAASSMGFRPVEERGAATESVAYFYLADATALPTLTSRARFTIVHAAYWSDLARSADLVLPAPLWSEKEGHLTNFAGQVQEVRQLVEPPGFAITAQRVSASVRVGV